MSCALNPSSSPSGMSDLSLPRMDKIFSRPTRVVSPFGIFNMTDKRIFAREHAQE